MNQPNTPLNILLADDDIDDRFFFDKALKEIKVSSNLVTVSNGELLMKYLSEQLQQLPDILFLDLSMPRKTGFECLAEIKDNEQLKDLPVIIFTTSFTRGIDFEDNLKKTFSKMGAEGYIRKPGDFEELKEVIHQTLQKMINRNNTAEIETTLQ